VGKIGNDRLEFTNKTPDIDEKFPWMKIFAARISLQVCESSRGRHFFIQAHI
jgi:hypothetical protein